MPCQMNKWFPPHHRRIGCFFYLDRNTVLVHKHKTSDVEIRVHIFDLKCLYSEAGDMCI